MYIHSGQGVTVKFTCQRWKVFFQRRRIVTGKSGQKKAIREHSNNEVSLAAAFVPTLTMSPCDMDPSQTGKVATYCEGLASLLNADRAIMI